MPQYKGKQYGRFQYGRYILHGKNGLKVSDAIRLRVIKNALHIQTMKETLTGSPQSLRLRTQNGEWVNGLSAVIKKETYKVRMRTNNGEWIESVRYTMKGE